MTSLRMYHNHLWMDKKNQVILAMVICSHLLMLWLLFRYNQSFQLNQADPTKRIQVQFVALSSIISDAQSSAASRSPSRVEVTNKPVLKPKIQENQPNKQQKILTTPVEHTVKHQAPEVTQPQKLISSEARQSAAVATPAQLTPSKTPSSSTTQSDGDAKGGQGKAKTQGGKPDGRSAENQQSNAAASPAPIEYLTVSKVDILSIGINYNDRDLQKQNREMYLSIYIDTKGKARNVIVKQSTGLNYLDELVVKAIYRAKFKPHIISGKAVPVKVEYPIHLNLSGR